jgi:hypothetical protein
MPTLATAPKTPKAVTVTVGGTSFNNCFNVKPPNWSNPAVDVSTLGDVDGAVFIPGDFPNEGIFEFNTPMTGVEKPISGTGILACSVTIGGISSTRSFNAILIADDPDQVVPNKPLSRSIKLQVTPITSAV